MTVADPNRVIFAGENHFIRLSTVDTDDYASVASFWRITLCAAGPGHALFVKSELTGGKWRIYSDNVATARWLQSTVQGMLVSDLRDSSIPVTDAGFAKSGDPRSLYSERVSTVNGEILLTWNDFGEALLLHTTPNSQPGRPYGMCSLFVPALGARLSLDGYDAAGRPWARQREGRPFSTCALAFSESWTEAR